MVARYLHLEHVSIPCSYPGNGSLLPHLEVFNDKRCAVKYLILIFLSDPSFVLNEAEATLPGIEHFLNYKRGAGASLTSWKCGGRKSVWSSHSLTHSPIGGLERELRGV